MPTNLIDITTGFFTDYVVGLELAAWHKGSSISASAPASLWLGLSTVLASTAGTISEPSAVNGYARVALPTATTFEPAYRGQTPSLVTLTFTPTADWPSPVVSCFLSDVSTIGSGRIFWAANLTAARTVTLAGGAVSFAPGALVVVK